MAEGTTTWIDENGLRRALHLFKGGGELFEVRLLRKMGSRKQTRSGYFRDVDKAVEEIKKFHLDGWNCFWTLNAINDACYSREQHDRITEAQKTTDDGDIVAYQWLLVDLDPVRPAEISSSNEELKKAMMLARKVYAFLANVGWEKPVVAMSGNGIHLLYEIGLKRSQENVDLISNVLKALDLLFSTDEVKVDTANFNPSRICKLYGTVAQKGAGTEERPHRMAYIKQVPEELKQTTKEYLQKVADMLPRQEKPQAYNNYVPQTFDVVRWMDEHGLTYKVKQGADYTKYILDECPFDPSHKAPDSMITVGSSGAIGFRCLHNSCQGKTWKDVRIKYEPNAYDRKDDDGDSLRIDAGWQQHRLHNRDKDIEYEDVEIAAPETPMFLTAEQILQMPTETEDFIRTGIDGIDNAMRGLKKGAISLLSGLRGGAKSTLLSTIILNAVNDDNNVICYSGELMPKNFMRWMLLQAAGKNHVSPTQWNGYYQVSADDQMEIAEWMGPRFLLYNNDYGNNFQKLYARLQKQIAEQKTDLVILDNLMALDIRDLDIRDKYSAQKEFVTALVCLAKKTLTHILFVAHPRKSNGFLRLEDVSGTNDLVNMVDDAFIVHRVNEDFKRLSQEMFHWETTHPAYSGTNVIEVAKDRDLGTQDLFIPLWYERETKRLKNSPSEFIHYGWEKDVDAALDGFMPVDDDVPF